jgi:hypothetical protein
VGGRGAEDAREYRLASIAEEPKLGDFQKSERLDFPFACDDA